MESSQDTTLQSLQEEVNELKKELQSVKSGVKVKKTRAPNVFNLYMKKAIPAVKAENPGLSHSEVFKLAAEQWKEKKGELAAEEATAE